MKQFESIPKTKELAEAYRKWQGYRRAHAKSQNRQPREKPQPIANQEYTITGYTSEGIPIKRYKASASGIKTVEALRRERLASLPAAEREKLKQAAFARLSPHRKAAILIHEESMKAREKHEFWKQQRLQVLGSVQSNGLNEEMPKRQTRLP